MFLFCYLVLEFELRKAQDTIQSLRASLTKTAGLLSFNQNLCWQKAVTVFQLQAKQTVKQT